MHGYEAHLELERRCIRDWAAISLPQIYLSLRRLTRRGLLRRTASGEPAGGPDKTVFETTAAGRKELADALERENWARQRDRPPFLTWLALSWLARPSVSQRQIQNRQKFLQKELSRERETLRSILDEVGHPHHEAVWMVTLMIEQFKTELHWLKKIARELRHRARAKRPAYAVGTIPVSQASR